ncbi:hypothetical protein JCM3775_002511 [Rhodotorula graminis]
MLQRSLARAARAQRTLQAAPRRSLWRCSTLISPSPASLLAHVEAQDKASTPGQVLYALSKNTPQELVPHFVAALQTSSSSSSSSPSIGCLAEVLPPSTVARLAPRHDTVAELYSLSIARHHPSHDTERAIPFRSTLTGRPNIALGREIRPELQHDAQDDAGFEAFLRGDKWAFGERANGARDAAGEGIEELSGVEPSQVKEVVALTADRMQPFLAALSSYSSAAKTGLVGTSTPFHSPNGAPFSLFYGTEVVSSGAIGVAVVGSTAAPAVKLDYGRLQAVGKPHEVTSSQGNIVLSLSNQNAARLLLDAVNELFGTSADNLSAVQRSEEKEKEFYAAMFDSEPVHPLDLSQARLVAMIMAGSPSRGALSVETEQEVATGSYLVFVTAPTSLSSSSSPATLSPPPSSLTFLSTSPSDTAPRFAASDAPAASPGDVVELDAFLAASENGVLFAPGQTGQVRVCAIEGASVRALEQ